MTFHTWFLMANLFGWCWARVHSWGSPLRLPLQRRHAFSSSPLLVATSSSSSSAADSQLQQQQQRRYTKATTILGDDAAFVKPDLDHHSYRLIELGSNGLQVLLVSDNLPAGTVAPEAAAVHVQAGHMDDSLPGLAHFHEHMLFLGTRKYPDEDDYEQYLSQHGGSSNAYTDMQDTNYYCSITTTAADSDGVKMAVSPALYGALDRLAQFFVAPTFSPDAVERELRAIDAEHSMSLTSDSWRNYQLLKHTAHPDHAFAKFGCGNYQTLTSRGLPTLLAELHKFWETYYRTYNMRLAVVGHASLDALQAAVEETFGVDLPYSQGPPRFAVPTSDKGSFFPSEHSSGVVAFGHPDQLGWIRHVVPYEETRVVKVYFATPPVNDLHMSQTKPHRVLSHLLGHEAPGSLYALLKDDYGYLQSLSAGIAIDTSDFSLFGITLALTPKGMACRAEVLDLLFQWLALFRRQVQAETDDNHRDEQDKIMPAYHDELRQIGAVNFRFREPSDPVDFCSAAAELLFDQHRPIEQFLSGATDDYDADVARALWDRLVPQNAMITVVNSDFTVNDDDSDDNPWEREPWYGAPFQKHRIADEDIQRWANPPSIDERLRLPALNQYIPTDFGLKCDEEKKGQQDNAVVAEDNDTVASQQPDTNKTPPTVLIDRPGLRLWHKMDRTWRVPKSYARLSFLSPTVYSTPRSMTLHRIFQRVLNDDLSSYLYDASLAGCNYRISCHPSGYRLTVRGYSEKVPFLLDTLLSRIQSLTDDMMAPAGTHPLLERRFATAKENLLRETKNFRLDSPTEVNSYNSRLLVEDRVWFVDDYLDELDPDNDDDATNYALTMAECAQAVKDCLWGRVRCEALAMGNMDQAGAQHVAQLVQDRILDRARPLSDVQVPVFRSHQLPTRAQAEAIFGQASSTSIPTIYQELAFSETEENNAVELVFQVGPEVELGYRGIAVLDVLVHIAYNSAFNQLRTKEQLGYYVSTFARKTAGASWSVGVLVQSGASYTPDYLQQRCEAWLEQFGQELRDMDLDTLAQEASAVVAQLREAETKLGQEVGRSWADILNTEGLPEGQRMPTFDRYDRLAQILDAAVGDITTEDDNINQQLPARHQGFANTADLKQGLLSVFDQYLAANSADRRALCARVYGHKAKDAYEASLHQPGVLASYADMRRFKQYLPTWPVVPYWMPTPKF